MDNIMLQCFGSITGPYTCGAARASGQNKENESWMRRSPDVNTQNESTEVKKKHFPLIETVIERHLLKTLKMNTSRCYWKDQD